MHQGVSMPPMGVSGLASACPQTPFNQTNTSAYQPAGFFAPQNKPELLPPCYIFDDEAATASVAWFKLLLEEAEYSLGESPIIETFQLDPHPSPVAHPKSEDQAAIFPFSTGYFTVNDCLNYCPSI